MKKQKLNTLVALRLDDRLYESLLHEASSERDIPRVIREKLEASYLSKDDAKKLLAQQEVLMNCMVDMLRSQSLPQLMLAMQLNDLEPKKRDELKGAWEDLKNRQAEKIYGYKRDAGL